MEARLNGKTHTFIYVIIIVLPPLRKTPSPTAGCNKL